MLRHAISPLVKIIRLRHFLYTACILLSVALCGCSSVFETPVRSQFGESVVFIGEEPATLAQIPLSGTPMTVRSTYLPNSPRAQNDESGTKTVEYVEGRDFSVDRRVGKLRRLPGSRLPDFRSNVLFGKSNFDHSQFPGFGNAGYFAFVDYSYSETQPWPVQYNQAHLLRATMARLKSGQPVKIVAYGDSITAGGDATKPEWIFWQRWADDLQRRYPRARVAAVNGATGGDSTAQGLQRLQAKVLDQQPDLVLVGFGMNDHNVGGVPIPQFEENLKQIITRIRAETGAEIVLFSTFPPNPHWKYGSHRMPEYAAATARVAGETACACADVFNNWQSLAARKKPEDLLGNNINHPNDFGHWMYFEILRHLGL